MKEKEKKEINSNNIYTQLDGINTDENQIEYKNSQENIITKREDENYILLKVKIKSISDYSKKK